MSNTYELQLREANVTFAVLVAIRTFTEARISSEGDLVVVVYDRLKPMKFLVSEVAMRLASPFWKNQVLKGERQLHRSFGREHATLLMIADPDALHILLLLAHLQFKKLPKTLPLLTLAKVATLAREYETQDLVSKYVSGWCKNLVDVEKDISSATVASHQLLIETFGVDNLEPEHVRAVMESMTEAQMCKCPAGGVHACNDPWVNARLECLASIVKEVYALYDRFKVQNLSCTWPRRSMEEADECKFQRFGSFAFFIRTIGLEPHDHSLRHKICTGRSLRGIKVAANAMVKRANREIEGAVHDACIRDIVSLAEHIQTAQYRLREP